MGRSARRDELALWNEARKRDAARAANGPELPFTVHDLSTGETYLVEQQSWDFENEETA